MLGHVGAAGFSTIFLRIADLLKDRGTMRDWDLARAAKAEKVGFLADVRGYFFIFWIGGGARADVTDSGCSSEVFDPRNRKRLLSRRAKVAR